MKDLFYRGIDWISHHQFIENLSGSEFCRGIIVGIITGIVIVLLLRLIIWFCFRRKACSKLDISNNSGKITVNAGAIYNVLKYAAQKIECLEITRIRIYRKRKFIDVELRARLDAAKGTVPQIMEKLTEIVKNEMSKVFGISNIRHVKLNISACRNDEENDAEFDDGISEKEVVLIKTGSENSKPEKSETPEKSEKSETPENNGK